MFYSIGHAVVSVISRLHVTRSRFYAPHFSASHRHGKGVPWHHALLHEHIEAAAKQLLQPALMAETCANNIDANSVSSFA